MLLTLLPWLIWRLHSSHTCACTQLNFGLGQAMSRGLARLDEELERAGLLPKLQPPPQVAPSEAGDFEAVRDWQYSCDLATLMGVGF